MRRKSIRGVAIEAVRPRSAAERAGIRRGDVLLSIGGNEVRDVIDYLFYRAGAELDIEVRRKDRKLRFSLPPENGDEPDLALTHFRVRTCRNKCVFCFVNQLPKGLRKPLYLKDEDYRMSFLYGNYITLTNLNAEDKKRITEQRLSPLYISVHSTDRALRNRMLGNPNAPDVMKEMRFFKSQGIRMHAQVVLCPGYNDGAALTRTIRDLGSLYPHVESVAVVPVGLTAHRKVALAPVEMEDSLRALETIESFQKKFRKRHGDPIVYGSDELYIKAGRTFPPVKEYGELPQIENGVGMVADFLARARRLKPASLTGGHKHLTFTGVSFYPYLAKFADRLRGMGADIRVVPVENAFFGSGVTVAGLLTGRDVIRTLSAESPGCDLLLIPAVALREGDGVFLDNVSVKHVEQVLNVRAVVVESTPEGLLGRMTET